MKKWLAALLALCVLPNAFCHTVAYFPQTQELEEYLLQMPWEYYR